MNVPLAQAIGTEKAKSELIIINIILELKRQRNIGLFSGIEFNIDKAIEMIAARMFNAREHQPYKIIYGAVTTGHIWKFLQLEHNHLIIDLEDYYIKNSGKIVAILAAMVDYKI